MRSVCALWTGWAAERPNAAVIPPIWSISNSTIYMLYTNNSVKISHARLSGVGSSQLCDKNLGIKDVRRSRSWSTSRLELRSQPPVPRCPGFAHMATCVLVPHVLFARQVLIECELAYVAWYEALFNATRYPARVVMFSYSSEASFHTI